MECDKEKFMEQCIWETHHILKFCLAEHRGYIINQVERQSTGSHFNQHDHSQANLIITILEKFENNKEEYRKERESYFIRKFNLYYKGMNKQT